MSLRSSTSSCDRALLSISVCVLVTVCGCTKESSRVAQTPLRQGVVDLDTLVRSNPQWRGVVDYDRAIRRLSARSLSYMAGSDVALFTLPPVAPGAQPASPELAVAENSLKDRAKERIHEIELRRQAARTQLIDRERILWSLDAHTEYVGVVKQARLDYSAAVIRITQHDNRRDVNLNLQIRSLAQTISDWSPAPNTPAKPALTASLEKLKEQLASKQAALDALHLDTNNALDEIRMARDQTISNAQAAEVSEVDNKSASEERRLTTLDNQQIMEASVRLSERMASLLKTAEMLRTAMPSIDSGMGPAAVGASPAVPSGSLSTAELQSECASLSAQRDRWKAYVTQDTVAAALDIAAQQHWSIQFHGPYGGRADLTQPLKGILLSKVWKA